MYKEARALPDHPSGPQPVAVQNRIKKLLENGFVQPGVTILSKLSTTQINNFIKIKQSYEAAMKAPTTPKGVIKPKSDKETAYQNNKALLKKYEALNPTSANKSKKLILACLKQMHQYEQEMKLKLTKSKFDHLLIVKPVVKKVAKKEPAKEKEKGAVAEVKEDQKTQNQVSKETTETTDVKQDEIEKNDEEVMEITEEQKDQIDATEDKIDSTEDATDADNVVDLENEQKKDDQQELENEKELLEED